MFLRKLLGVTLFWQDHSRVEDSSRPRFVEVVSENGNEAKPPTPDHEKPLTPDSPYTAAEVIARERKFISKSHPEAYGGEPNQLIGLALSGGGIRSATFNLGVLQALAKKKVLPKVAYLSTVSGGGYIGSWLTAWAHRAGFRKVCEELELNVRQGKAPADSPGRPGDPHFFEPNPVHWLRKYTSYLAPERGWLSRDTWTLVGIYLRNLFLNQAFLVAWTFVALCLLQLLVLGYLLMGSAHPISAWPWWAAFIGCGLFIVVVVPAAEAWWQFDLKTTGSKTGKASSSPAWSAWVIGGAIASAVLLSFALTPQSRPFLPNLLLPFFSQASGVAATSMAWFAVAGALLLSAGSALVWGYKAFREKMDRQSLRALRQRAYAALSENQWGNRLPPKPDEGQQRKEVKLDGVKSDQRRRRLFGTPVAGALGGLLVYLCWQFFQWLPVVTKDPVAAAAYMAAVAAPLILVALVLTSFVHIGLVGLEFPDARREWMGTIAGTLMKFALIWAVVGALSLGGRDLIRMFFKWSSGWKLGEVLQWFLPSGWVVAVVSGLLAAYSSKTGTRGSKWYFELLAKAAPPLFLAGVIMVMAWVLGNVSHTDLQFWMVLGIGTAAGLWLWAVLDVNEFSMHLLYRNRLVRAYLGASNTERRAHPYTKFAVNDDIFLADLADCDPVTEGPSRYDGPYPLLCAALNLVNDENLEFQERKATSFIYSPLFCGFDKLPSGKEPEEVSPGYRPTRVKTKDDHDQDKHVGCSGEWGPHLGTALAASGAALSPNMGYHSSPAVTALMTFFNVRVGWWVGNPALPRTQWMKYGPERNQWRNYGPKPFYLFNELLSRTNDHSNYVYLSDGGHFENLGIYELVRRRVPCIIACDVGEDSASQFADLGSAIEKCRRDFGAEITINVTGLKPQSGSKLTAAHFAVGHIQYAKLADADPKDPVLKDFASVQDGWLLYIKPALTGDESQDVLSHRNSHEEFPQDTTANQFFTESIFESYRQLGLDAGDKTLTALLADLQGPDCKILMDCLKRHFEDSQPKPSSQIEIFSYSQYRAS